MKITDKYVLREHLGPLLFALSALTSLLLLNYIAKRFGALVGKGLPWRVIGEFFVLSIPFTVAMTIPMAVLVATLYAFSRMAAENEVTAFKASGVSMRRLMAPVLLAATALAAGMIFFNDQILPRANHRLAVLQSDIVRKKPTFALRPQVTNRVTDRLWLRAGQIESGDRMRDIIIYDFSDPERPRTVHADSGTLAMTPDQANLALELHDGVIREFPRSAEGSGVMPGSGGESASFQQTFFVRNRVIVRGVGNQLQRTDAGGGQIKSNREQTVCELHASYTRHVIEYRRAHAELVELAERQSRGGATVEVPALEDTYERTGLGALYCRLVGGLRVKEAVAAEPPQPPVPAADSVPADSAAADSSATDSAGVDAAVVPDSLLKAPAPGEAPVGVPEPDPLPGPEEGEGTMVGGRNISTVLLDAANMRLASQWETLNGYDVEIHKKFALAVACIVFVLLGAPIALRFPRGGVGLVIGVSLLVFGLYYVGLIAGETVADKGYLPPWAAMWAANIVFTLAGLILLVRVGREGATSRGGDLGEMLDAVRGALAGVGRRIGLPLERRSPGAS